METVSVLIPNYNSGRFLKRAIGTVADQNYPNKEVIIIDHGSTDSSTDVIEEIRRLHENRFPVIRLATTTGSYHTLDSVVMYSTGEYITFLGARDTLIPESLDTRIKYLQDHPDLDGIFTNNRLVTNSGAVYGTQEVPKFTGSSELADKIKANGKIPISPFTLMLRKNAFEKAGLLDRAYSSLLIPHLEFIYNILNTCNIGYSSVMTYNHYTHSNNPFNLAIDRMIIAYYKSMTLARNFFAHESHKVPAKKSAKESQ